MSRHRTSKDNAVIERFVPTFKEHRINGVRIQDKLDAEVFLNPQSVSFRNAIARLTVHSLAFF